MDSWERVREFLAGRGFTIVPGSGKDRYQGQIRVGSVPVSLEIEITDYDFLDLPKIRVLKREALPKRLTAHIISDGALCYADKTTFLLDRYQPDRSLASCIEQARTTLNTVLHGNPGPAYMAELAAYWSATPYCLIDEKSELTRCVFGVCAFQNGPQILIAGRNEERLETWSKKAGGIFTRTFEAPVVHAIDAIRPPSSGTFTLQGAIDWLQPQTESARSLVDLAIGTAKETPSLLITASNAIIGFRAEKTTLIKKSEQGGFRASTLPGLWRKEAGRAILNTFHCVPASHDEITARNLDGAAPLTGKRLAMIGCGTIGGYLARTLVQLGAGHGAALLLIDHDDLKPENLGRHILGARDLWRSKSVALADQLSADFPDALLEAVNTTAKDSFDRFAGYDLVVDATGDEQFSDALNAFALARLGAGGCFPPVLFTMLLGNGLAAQSFLARWKKGSACYRCLKPRFEEERRYNPLKPGAKKTRIAVRPCAQGSFIPYAVTASIQAAALAASHASDFFLDLYEHDLRTVQVDSSSTVYIPFKNVDRAKFCPACQT